MTRRTASQTSGVAVLAEMVPVIRSPFSSVDLRGSRNMASEMADGRQMHFVALRGSTSRPIVVDDSCLWRSGTSTSCGDRSAFRNTHAILRTLELTSASPIATIRQLASSQIEHAPLDSANAWKFKLIQPAILFCSGDQTLPGKSLTLECARNV